MSTRPQSDVRQRARSPACEGRPAAALAAAALLFFVPAISSLARKSATYDEPVYVIAGLSYLSLGDYTMKEDAPPLIATLAGLSPLLHGLAVPGGRLPFHDPLGREYRFARTLLYRSGMDADAILFWSRLAVLVPFGLLLLTTTYAFARDLFGTRAGFFAVALVALSPNLIAHGRLVAADFASSAAFLFASWRLWRLAREPRTSTALLAGAALGLALATKYTALLLLPVYAVVIGLAAWTPPRWGARMAATAVLLVVASALAIPLLVYGFPPQPGRFVHGMTTIYRNVRSDYSWYVFGSFYPGGVLWYYPAVLAVKVSAPLLILGVASFFAIRRTSRGLVSELCLFAPSALLLLAAMNDTIPAGIRRVLPLLPALAVSASRLVSPNVRLPAKRTVLAALLVWHAASSLASWPHYLAYFNELAGGRSNGPELLDDSNLDWGEDLAEVPAVVEALGLGRIHLYYFGIADPEFYGIDAEQHATTTLTHPEPGVWAVSVHHLVRLRGAGLDWLEKRRPIAKAGTSIWFFRIDPPREGEP